jgi:hypothetical protein
MRHPPYALLPTPGEPASRTPCVIPGAYAAGWIGEVVRRKSSEARGRRTSLLPTHTHTRGEIATCAPKWRARLSCRRVSSSRRALWPRSRAGTRSRPRTPCRAARVRPSSGGGRTRQLNTRTRAHRKVLRRRRRHRSRSPTSTSRRRRRARRWPRPRCPPRRRRSASARSARPTTRTLLCPIARTKDAPGCAAPELARLPAPGTEDRPVSPLAGVEHVPKRQRPPDLCVCRLPSCDRPCYRDPATGSVHEFCGRSHAAAFAALPADARNEKAAEACTSADARRARTRPD